MRTDPFDLTGCNFHREGESGPWRIERRTIQAGGFLQRTPPGTYTGLLCNGSVWMSDVPDEKRQHYEAYRQARQRGGRCLVHGLGLGMVVKAMADLPDVEHIDVVELDPDVIALAGPAFDRYDARVTIHQDDALTRKWPAGTRWAMVWHDIWQDICVDNLSEMATLHRKFGRRADWQGSWSHSECLYYRRRESRHAWF
jgi:hypothetical protein